MTLPPAHGGDLGTGDARGMHPKGVTLFKGANVFVSVWIPLQPLTSLSLSLKVLLITDY